MSYVEDRRCESCVGGEMLGIRDEKVGGLEQRRGG